MTRYSPVEMTAALGLKASVRLPFLLESEDLAVAWAERLNEWLQPPAFFGATVETTGCTVTLVAPEITARFVLDHVRAWVKANGGTSRPVVDGASVADWMGVDE